MKPGSGGGEAAGWQPGPRAALHSGGRVSPPEAARACTVTLCPPAAPPAKQPPAGPTPHYPSPRAPCHPPTTPPATPQPSGAGGGPACGTARGQPHAGAAAHAAGERNPDALRWVRRRRRVSVHRERARGPRCPEGCAGPSGSRGRRARPCFCAGQLAWLVALARWAEQCPVARPPTQSHAPAEPIAPPCSQHV